jgi:hypothetical protein
VPSHRDTALLAAISLHTAAGDLRIRPGVAAAETVATDEVRIRRTADVFLAWLQGPVRVYLAPGPVTDQHTGQPTGTPSQQGDAVQIHDNEQFDLTVHEVDGKGFETSDPGASVAWVSSDETVAPVGVSPDGLTFHVVAGVPGTSTVQATLTLADGTVLPPASVAVDVLPAGAVAVTLAAGPVSVQP